MLCTRSLMTSCRPGCINKVTPALVASRDSKSKWKEQLRQRPFPSFPQIFNPLFILVSLSQQQPHCYSNRRRRHSPVYTILVSLSQQPRCCSDAKGYDRLPQMHEFLLPPLRSCSLLFVASKVNTLKHPKLLTQITHQVKKNTHRSPGRRLSRTRLRFRLLFSCTL